MIGPAFNLIISFIIALILHELGHWMAARLCSVPVTAVGLGWGPKLCSQTLGNVNWQLRVLPFGAFVRMDMVTLQKRPLPQQLFVLSAGVMMNFLLCVLTWRSTFALLNLALAIGNLLPLYQHDGWKSCLVVSRWILGKQHSVVEWSITVIGALMGMVLLAGAFMSDML